MNIAVNTRLLIKDKLEGIGWFTFEAMRRITVNHPEHHFFFLFDRPYSDEFIFSDNITPLVLKPPARHPILLYSFFEWSVARALKKHKIDIFISTDGFLPLKSKVPAYSVVHDLNFEEYPEFLPFSYRHYYKYFFPKFVEKAKRIASVSHFSKNDLQKRYNIDPDKIDVVYNGVNEEFKPLNSSEIKNIREENTGGCPYFISVGSIHQRKNISNLIKAFSIFKQKDDKQVKLLIAGEKRWMNSEMTNAYKSSKFQKDIIFAGRLSNKELHELMAAALALTYVSFYEGFGIPILESMRCNIPVITSTTTSMPEVADEAALLCDPNSVQSISDAMQQVVSDTDLRQSLIEKGRIRSKEFSWDKTAEDLWASIKKIL